MYRLTALVIVAAALAGACARVASPLGNGDTGAGGVGGAGGLGGAGGGGGVPGSADVDLAMPSTVADLGTPADLATRAAVDLAVATPPDLATAPPDLATPGALCHPVINEVQTGTSATGTEEFVELYNPCSAAVTITGWKLVYRAATNTNARGGADSATLFTFPTGTFAAGGYRVYAGSGFKGSFDGPLASGIAASGAIGLRDGAGNLVDSVAFGSVAGNTFIEGSAAAPLPPTLASPGGSIERLPNGADSDDNSHDFATASQATPGAANH